MILEEDSIERYKHSEMNRNGGVWSLYKSTSDKDVTKKQIKQVSLKLYVIR